METNNSSANDAALNFFQGINKKDTMKKNNPSEASSIHPEIIGITIGFSKFSDFDIISL